MREILFDEIKKAVAENDNVFFVTGDVGFNLVESMLEKFPDRAMNVGVAEQNLVGVAAGLCNLGFKPILYSYTNFLAERAFEQIRDDICLHNYAPILVGTTTGFDNGILGPTHLALDDMAGIKALPNIRIYSPSTNESMRAIFQEALTLKNEAAFIRFTKSGLSESKEITEINRFIISREASTILTISHGKMVQNIYKAIGNHSGVSLFAMDRIKPFDGEAMGSLLKTYKKIIVIEDNFKSAGLFNSIAQFFVEHNIQGVELLSLSPKEEYEERIGSAEYFEDRYGLTPEKIEQFIAAVE